MSLLIFFIYFDLHFVINIYFRLIRIQRKVYAANLALEYFLMNNWKFLNDKGRQLDTKLLPQDRTDWEFESDKIKPYNYFKGASLGGKKYLLRENVDDLEKDRSRLFKLVL